MPRTARASVGDVCYHVLNRGNGRMRTFHEADDYAAFVDLLGRACERVPMRVLAYVLMPNHFHLTLWPRVGEDLGRWMHWLLTSHVRRHHRPEGPGRAAEDAVIVAGVPPDQAADGPEHPRDGATAQGQNGTDGQRHEALERRLGKGDGKTHEERLGSRWKGQHRGLLSDSLTLIISQNRQESAFCASPFSIRRLHEKRQKSN